MHPGILGDLVDKFPVGVKRYADPCPAVPREPSTSPHSYPLMRRLERVRGSGRSLGDIAVETGFSDQAHFAWHFKDVHGLTPGHWASLSGR
jgi:hypothetical protein